MSEQAVLVCDKVEKAINLVRSYADNSTPYVTISNYLYEIAEALGKFTAWENNHESDIFLKLIFDESVPLKDRMKVKAFLYKHMGWDFPLFFPSFEYSHSFYDGTLLKYYALECLEVLPEDVTHLISGGSSGCAIASSMLVLAKRQLFHRHIYTTTEGNGHRGMGLKDKTSGCFPRRFDPVTAIVDDMIDSGNTIRSLFTRIDQSNHLKYVVIAHDYYFGSDKKYKDIKKDLGLKVISADYREKADRPLEDWKIEKSKKSA